MRVDRLEREFSFNGTRLGDPNPAMTVDEVKRHYQTAYPEIVNAQVSGPENTGGKLVYTLAKKTGVLG